jgi:Fuc2NAc and GlcNAc transferase
MNVTSPMTFGLVAAAGIVSWAVTGLVRRYALRKGMMDVPNARSSHTVPTPRGGGMGIVLAMAGVLACALISGAVPASVVWALTGAFPVALIGLRDDYRPVSALLRLLVHIGSAAWAMWWLGGLPPMQVGESLMGFGPFAPLFGVVGIIWVLNLFNFMDGIDGIAGAECAFICLAGGGLMLAGPGDPGLAGVCLALAAACLGFLVWNWAPARIFMGDVGSGFTGYLIAVLAVAAAILDPAALLIWLILGGAFFVDATVTLIRRLSRREKLHVAHRSHLYQRLSRAWGSHAKVSLAYTALNVCWLLPWALAARLNPTLAGWIALVALVPLLLVAVWMGAGRADSADIEAR